MVGRTPPAPGHMSVPYLTTGQIRDDRRLAAAYAACDVVCVPSLVDNAPQTASEASTTGRPVVAYASGGIPDLVDDGSTGLLANTGDIRALARAVETLLEQPSYAKGLGRAGRVRALNEWNPRTIGGRYRNLYADVLHTAG
jgi:Glycosyltransferase